MNIPVKFFLLTDSECRRLNLTDRDVKNLHYDTVRMGYLVKPNSQALTLLLLKGTRLHDIY